MKASKEGIVFVTVYGESVCQDIRAVCDDLGRIRLEKLMVRMDQSGEARSAVWEPIRMVNAMGGDLIVGGVVPPHAFEFMSGNYSSKFIVPPYRDTST